MFSAMRYPCPGSLIRRLLICDGKTKSFLTGLLDVGMGQMLE